MNRNILSGCCSSFDFSVLCCAFCFMIDTDCTGSCKSNYHMITTTTAPDNSSSSYATETYFVMQLDILTEIESILINFFNTNLIIH